MAIYCGIDLGTTNSTVSIMCCDGNLVTIPIHQFD